MICFRDTSYCSDAEQCKNKETCMRWFSPSEEAAARRWWGEDDPPVAFRSFKDSCDRWEEVK